MNKLFILPLILVLTMLQGCSNPEDDNYRQGLYLLLDTSGTYTEELTKAQNLIKYLLADLQAGDTFAVARIDSGSFSEKDIVARVTLDGRPSLANQQKREFAAEIDEFIENVQPSPYTDISGGLLQAVEYLNESGAGDKTIMIYSDLKEDLPKGYVRDFSLTFDGFNVQALNVTKLRSDNQNPQEYLDRLQTWGEKVIQGGGNWTVVNDLEGLLSES